MANGVFINYRWGNDHGWVHAIWSSLERHIPPHKIFVDIDGIRPGQHIRTVVEDAIRESDVLLPVIGPDWLSVSHGASRRIDDPADYVRFEIVTALDENKEVIPVLVDDAQMPAEHALPAPLRRLAGNLAVSVTHRTFREDMKALISAIFAAFARADAERQQRSAISNASHQLAPVGTNSAAHDRATEWRTIALFGIAGLLATFVSAVFYQLAASWTSSLGIHGASRVLIEYAVGALPFATAWPLASYLAGFRTRRSLLFITLIFLAAWVIVGLYWETTSIVGSKHFPIDREIISNLAIIGGWAAFIPRLRRLRFFLVAALLGVLGSIGSYLFARSSIPWDLVLVFLQGVCLNVPMCVLVGYGVANRGPLIVPKHSDWPSASLRR
jgi:hypothetical protein